MTKKSTGQAIADLNQYDKDSRWIAEHFEELHAKHADTFVFVHKGEVIAVAANAREFEKRYAELGDLSPEVICQFITKKKRTLILAKQPVLKAA
jgi:hypothetical protein